MQPFQAFACSPGDSLPALEAPFAVLIDTDDDDWKDFQVIRKVGKLLLKAGCRCFVCFGQRSEYVHDCIDDLILDYQLDGVTTTFHDDETKEEVFGFLMSCAKNGMKDILIFARDISEWKTYI